MGRGAGSDGQRFHVTPRDEASQRVIGALQNVYRKKLRPVEEAFFFGQFHYDAITDTELEAKSQVLVIGQYSTGKTTFIRHLLGADFPNMNIGPEPTTDKFTVVIHGQEDRPVEGNSLAVVKELPYEGLSRFGPGLLDKLDAAISTSPFLENITLVDTPGVLSGKMQMHQRAYSFADVSRWFGDRSDLILVLFDAHRLDVSDELMEILMRLKDHQSSIRIVLNKADQVDKAELRRAMISCWALVALLAAGRFGGAAGYTSSEEETTSTCANGLPGISSGSACCVEACDFCGGTGCGSIAGTNGAEDCCAETILSLGIACVDTAPCVMVPGTFTPAPTATSTATPSGDGGVDAGSTPAPTTFDDDSFLPITPAPTAFATGTVAPGATPAPSTATPGGDGGVDADSTPAPTNFDGDSFLPVTPAPTVATTGGGTVGSNSTGTFGDTGDDNDPDSEAPLGAIVGGTVAGVLAVVAVIAAVLFKSGRLKIGPGKNSTSSADDAVRAPPGGSGPTDNERPAVPVTHSQYPVAHDQYPVAYQYPEAP